MKVFRRCASMILACVILLGTSAYAVSRSSEQIYRYYLDAGSGDNGLIAVDFTISATGTMKNIGAETIVTESPDEFEQLYALQDTSVRIISVEEMILENLQ